MITISNAIFYIIPYITLFRTLSVRSHNPRDKIISNYINGLPLLKFNWKHYELCFEDFLSSVRLLRREIRKWMYYVLLAIRRTIQQVGSEKPSF